MDLSSFDTRAGADAGITVDLVRPDNGQPLLDTEEKPMWVRVYGADSKKFQAARHQVIDKAAELRSRSNQSTKNEELEARNLEIIARAVTDWHIQLNGDCPECNLLNVRRVFDRFPWLYEQVQGAVHDRGACLGNLQNN